MAAPHSRLTASRRGAAARWLTGASICLGLTLSASGLAAPGRGSEATHPTALAQAQHAPAERRGGAEDPPADAQARGDEDRGGRHRHGGDEADEDRSRTHSPLLIENAASSGWDDGRSASVQVQLLNSGRRTLHDLRITHLEFTGGSYAGPQTLPWVLGNLPAANDTLVDAVFTVPADGSARTLKISGDYVVDDDEDDGHERHGHEHPRRHAFHLSEVLSPDAAEPGPFVVGHGESTVHGVAGAVFPPALPPADFGPNAETPIFIPLGPPRLLFPPTPTGTPVASAGGAAAVAVSPNSVDPNAVFNNQIPPDASAAASGTGPTDVVLMSNNLGISYSVGGGSFTNINIKAPQPGNPARATFFPESDGGVCCDQVVIYLPAQDLFVWLLQYNPNAAKATPAIPPANICQTPNVLNTTGRLRVAWATPAAIRADFWNAWTYADFTGNAVANVSSGLGTNGDEWLDYPDLAYSGRFLYLGIDHGCNTPGSVFTGQRIVARLSLADLANPAASIVHYDYAQLSGSNGLNKTHFVQGAPGRMVAGSLDNSSTLRVFSWNDGDSAPGSGTVAISQIQQGNSYSAPAPDGVDWYAASFPGNITGAVYRRILPGLGADTREEYLFAFDAGANAGSNRPQAYVRLETLTPGDGANYNAFAEYDVWNPNYAYGMSALGTDGQEIGLSLAVGGGTLGFPQVAVGYKDDFVVYQVTSSTATQAAAGGGTRFGDYFDVRPVPNSGGKFVTQAYDVLLNPLPPGTVSGNCATIGCSTSMRFVEFGRPPPPPIK